MGHTLEIKTTPVFDKNWNAFLDKNIRFIINQGGSRSSKTYSINQLLIVYCLCNSNKIVSIIRKTFPSLRGSAMRDFFEILDGLGLYKIESHNKTENIYRFDNGSLIEFFSADDQQKLRGRKRDICFVNEANEISYEEFNQLNMRTTDKLIFDFNPSEASHWLYELISRNGSILIHSTYKDNTFLSPSLISEIENLINYDENYYRIYALGERGLGKSTIYTHWKYYDIIPETKEKIYAIDFGYNHPTAMVECNFIENEVYIKEIIYQTGLTVSDLITRLIDLGIDNQTEIICDSARPEIIEDLKRKGYNTKPANKNVKEGIDSVKTISLFIHKESINLLKELTYYKWKMNGETILDEPVKVLDDLVDAMRYGIHWYKLKYKKKPGTYNISWV